MNRHPEDNPDWQEYTQNRGDWQIPQSDTPPPQSAPPAHPHQPGTGPYGVGQAPWPVDDRDPNPPRQSTPYNETSQFTNPHAWRYQQNPYDGDGETVAPWFFKALGLALLLAVGVVAIAWALT